MHGVCVCSTRTTYMYTYAVLTQADHNIAVPNPDTSMPHMAKMRYPYHSVMVPIPIDDHPMTQFRFKYIQPDARTKKIPQIDVGDGRRQLECMPLREILADNNNIEWDILAWYQQEKLLKTHTRYGDWRHKHAEISIHDGKASYVKKPVNMNKPRVGER